MSRSIRHAFLLFLLLLPLRLLMAEKVADLPAPTGYVNDFAGVLSQGTRQSVEALCREVDQQAGAQMAVVTIKTLDNDQTVEEFTVELEEKWKVGKKGTDKGLILLIVLNPKKLRTEVGYGLEGVLNDAKVGRIQQTMVPLLRAGNYDAAVVTGTQAYAKEIAADAGVTLTQPTSQYDSQYGQYQYRRQPQRGSGIGGLIGLGILVGLVILMIATGNGGWLWVILSMFLNGGGRGGRGGGFGGGGGGGFGGFGGGSSGGGGNSSDY
ncbi:TPM domain-containing protein [Granulicella sp. WH15]|uniref:TPM domain-containing protein n=1 Tax=Granulicella sp. WH15 TaxID=2602070 RepID=UPI00136709D8|nr:TPM domain-containing protein [Granulicella sp. WH15]QHN02796.1 TPM domain-containing protein [Granulicella sp. WH15]